MTREFVDIRPSSSGIKSILDRGALQRALDHAGVIIKPRQIDSLYIRLFQQGFPPLETLFQSYRNELQALKAVTHPQLRHTVRHQVSHHIPLRLIDYVLNSGMYRTMTTTIASTAASASGHSIQFHLVLPSSGRHVRTVVTQYKLKDQTCLSVTVSSQVGSYCLDPCGHHDGPSAVSTDTVQNLTAYEILEQVIHATTLFPGCQVQNVSFMGTGEPLMNYDHVVTACHHLLDAHTFNLGKGHITIGTAGVTSRMYDLTRDVPSVILAIGLHAPTQELREKVVPLVAPLYPLEGLLEAAEQHMHQLYDEDDISIVTSDSLNPNDTGSTRIIHRQNVMMEYLMVEGSTSELECAQQLGRLSQGKKWIVNLIPYLRTKMTPRDKYACPSLSHMRAFQMIVSSYGVKCHIRLKMGSDVVDASQLVVHSKMANEAEYWRQFDFAHHKTHKDGNKRSKVLERMPLSFNLDVVHQIEEFVHSKSANSSPKEENKKIVVTNTTMLSDDFSPELPLTNFFTASSGNNKSQSSESKNAPAHTTHSKMTPIPGNHVEQANTSMETLVHETSNTMRPAFFTDFDSVVVANDVASSTGDDDQSAYLTPADTVPCSALTISGCEKASFMELPQNPDYMDHVNLSMSVSPSFGDEVDELKKQYCSQTQDYVPKTEVKSQVYAMTKRTSPPQTSSPFVDAGVIAGATGAAIVGASMAAVATMSKMEEDQQVEYMNVTKKYMSSPLNNGVVEDHENDNPDVNYVAVYYQQEPICIFANGCQEAATDAINTVMPNQGSLEEPNPFDGPRKSLLATQDSLTYQFERTNDFVDIQIGQNETKVYDAETSSIVCQNCLLLSDADFLIPATENCQVDIPALHNNSAPSINLPPMEDTLKVFPSPGNVEVSTVNPSSNVVETDVHAYTGSFDESTSYELAKSGDESASNAPSNNEGSFVNVPKDLGMVVTHCFDGNKMAPANSTETMMADEGEKGDNGEKGSMVALSRRGNTVTPHETGTDWAMYALVAATSALAILGIFFYSQKRGRERPTF